MSSQPGHPALELGARVERGVAATRIVLEVGGDELWLQRGALGAFLAVRDTRAAPGVVDALRSWLGAPPAHGRGGGTLHALSFELDDRVNRADPVSLASMRLDIRFPDALVPLELELDEAAGTARLHLLDPGFAARLADFTTRYLTSAEPARLADFEQLALPPSLSVPAAATPDGVLAIACNHGAIAQLWRWAGPPAAPERLGAIELRGHVHAVAPGPGAGEVTVFVAGAATPGSWSPDDLGSIVVVDVAAATSRTIVEHRSHIWYEPGLAWSPDGRLAVAVSYDVPSAAQRRLRAAVDVLDQSGAIVATSPGFVQLRTPRWVDGRVMCIAPGSGDLRPEHVTWDPATNAITPVPSFTETSPTGAVVTADDAGVRIAGGTTSLPGLIERHDWSTPATWLDATTCLVHAHVATSPTAPPRLVAIDAATGAWTTAARTIWTCASHAARGALVISDHDQRLWWTRA